jgi:hypothetical protein
VSERDIGNGEIGTESCADRRHLAVQRAADDRQTAERLRSGLCLFFGVANGVLQRRVGELHHMGARLGRELEPPGQIHVEHVEASGAETQLERLDVDHDLVAEGHRACHPRVGNTRATVDL